MSFWIQLAVVLACILIGARLGGIGIGLAGGLGLVILVFGFGLQPTTPPVDVMLIIAAVITMVATVQAAGGLDYLITLAEKILRKNPRRITLVAPLVTYFFTLFCGTAYVAFALYPVIVEVAYGANERPERPLSIATVAATQAVTASPMSAATAVLITMVSPPVTLRQILMICVPAGLAGVLTGALSVYKKGVELADDPEFQRRLAAGELTPPRKFEASAITTQAKLSVMLFVVAIVIIVILGSSPRLLPAWNVNGKLTSLSIPDALEMMMLCSGLITALLFNIKPSKIINSSIFSTGMMAVVAIFGIAWMVDTFFTAHSALLVAALGQFVKTYPYLFAVALVVMAALLLSQGAAIRAIGPLGLTLGISPVHLVGMFHAASAINIIPGTGAVIGAISFDRTGTTRIGRLVLNHSFILPGLVSIGTSVVVGYLLASFLL